MITSQKNKIINSLRCVLCGTKYSTEVINYTCSCNSSAGVLDVEYDYKSLAALIKKSDISNSKLIGMWRYLPLLPISADARLPEICVGNTPLSRNQFLANKLNLQSVLIKDESRLPSGSLKDRASALAVVHAIEMGFNTIATASTGNAAAALACLSANIGLRAVVYVPKDTPSQKLLAIRAYGAEVIEVIGTYDEAFEQCLRDSKTNGWYNRNTAHNPYMTEGKKTVAYEISEQLGWSVPDAIFVGVGDGSIIGGIYKGFFDLKKMGWTKSMPKLFGVQPEGSNYLVRAWENKVSPLNLPQKPANTIADSLKAELPKDRIKAMNAVIKTSGAFVQVSDLEILDAMTNLSKVGYLTEPAAAASLAGLCKARENNLVKPGESVVLINTGTGLKDTLSIEKMLQNRLSGQKILHSITT